MAWPPEEQEACHRSRGIRPHARARAPSTLHPSRAAADAAGTKSCAEPRTRRQRPRDESLAALAAAVRRRIETHCRRRLSRRCSRRAALPPSPKGRQREISIRELLARLIAPGANGVTGVKVLLTVTSTALPGSAVPSGHLTATSTGTAT